MSSAQVTRRTLLLAAAGAVFVPTAVRFARERGYDRERGRAYEALVGALLLTGALPGTRADAASAGDRLSALYADALPRRRGEIDDVLDALAQAGFADRRPEERIALLRAMVAEGGTQRAVAARATALAAAAYGPADRALPVVI